MWKWIAGAVLVLAALAAGTCWYGYQKLTEGGNSVAVTIAASPSRIYASLANHDSLATWSMTAQASSKHGMFARGDTLNGQASSSSNPRARTTSTVTDVMPNLLVAVSVRSDSSGMVVATRRDSLVAMGDSTKIITTITAPMFDSIGTRKPGSSSGATGTLMGMSSKVLVSGFRMQAEVELNKLKGRIEGSGAPR